VILVVMMMVMVMVMVKVEEVMLHECGCYFAPTIMALSAC
jgi:hypothetical protein